MRRPATPRGADVVAYRLDKSSLQRDRPRRRGACAQGLAARSPAMQVLPDDKLHRDDTKVTVEIGGVATARSSC
jgi:hypothetical protein